MLAEARNCKLFWAEAVRHAAYLHNRTVSPALQRTPHRMHFLVIRHMKVSDEFLGRQHMHLDMRKTEGVSLIKEQKLAFIRS